MCYSAQTWQDYRRYVREFGATISIRDFVELFRRRLSEPGIKIPKAMELAFLDPQDEAEREVKALIDEFNSLERVRVEAELFKQRKRLADAERALQAKQTKAATESKRIATDKVGAALARLDDLRRVEPKPRDSRIFPGYYTLVLVQDEGHLLVRPMRYQCRPAGKPASYDRQYPGTYNARRDNLTKFWKNEFGFSHGIMVVNAFFENVTRQEPGEAPKNVVLEFRPNPPVDMLVACLWSHWTGPGGPDLLSCAAITDEPPPEVAAAGHDRCIVPIEGSNLQAWLNPQRENLAPLQAILDARAKPYYEHRLAA